MRLMLLPALALALLLTGLLVPGQAGALSIDFETDSAANPIEHGDVLEVQYQLDGVVMSASNPNQVFDLAVAFNTNTANTADPDLEGPAILGNLSGMDLGNIAILAENPAGAQPDDEGGSPAGEIFLELDFEAATLGFDLIDIEDSAVEAGGVDFYSGGAIVASFEWTDLMDMGSVVYDPSVEFGDRSANRVMPVDVADLGVDSYDKLGFRLGGSGGIDNIEIEEAAVPEPGSLALLGVAGALLALRARRRSS